MYFLLMVCCLSIATLTSAISHEKAEQLSKEWLLHHTKRCPDCGIAIQKNGGCDWMKCTYCAHEFCWECLAPHDHNLATHKHQYKVMP